MRSPLQLLSGAYESALLTTYSFNLAFFEAVVLPVLWAAEVRNIVVFADPTQLGHALGDHAPAAAGRTYHLVAARTAAAAFHPKLMLITGADGARLCVSSANLTADGLLRNLESAIAFDSHLHGHSRPIAQAGELYRRLSELAPAHTAEAIQRALTRVPQGDDAPSPFDLLHNLDQPLVEQFPTGASVTAVVPYVDADGAAAAELHRHGALTVIVDGDRIAANPTFFEGPWAVEPRVFPARLHGKAYELTTPAGRWVLIGSPNLSSPALSRVAAAGNLEVAIAVTAGEPLELPASEAWTGAELPLRAAERLAADRARDSQEDHRIARAFDAWEDGSQIRVAGLPDGCEVERLDFERWIPLGIVNGGTVLIADPELRPTRVRARLSNGAIAYAVVALPARLRTAARARSGRHGEAVRKLPLDLETVRILEEALSQLYALAEIVGEAGSTGPKIAGPQPSNAGAAGGLRAWMPRSPEDEPRVPALYLNAWKGEPDVLLALISRALRLEQVTAAAERDVMLEQVELDQLEQITDEATVDAATTGEANGKPPPESDRAQLERYRRALRDLLRRGQRFITTTVDAALAGWAFTYLAALLEDVGSHSVRVEGHGEPLMPHADLAVIRLELLVAYLARDEHDPICLASARGHLAAAIRDRPRFTARDRERLDELAFHWAAELLEVPGDVPKPDESALGLGVVDAGIWLEDYAERSQWQAIEREAAVLLDPVWLQDRPWPTLIGCAPLTGRVASPAWRLIGFAAPAGFAGVGPFSVVVVNSGDGPLVAHALICDPASQRLTEGYQRSADQVWVSRQYWATNRATIEALQSPISLDPIGPFTEHQTIAATPDPLSALAPVLEAVDALR